jgi:hypothetical protein
MGRQQQIKETEKTVYRATAKKKIEREREREREKTNERTRIRHPQVHAIVFAFFPLLC